MMSLDKFVEAGKIVKAHSFSGALKVMLHQPVLNPDAFPVHLFIGIAPQPVPFFIEKLELTDDDKAIIKFEEVDDKEAANKLLKKNIYLTVKEYEAVFGPLKEEETNLSDLQGYLLVDKKLGELAVIEDVLELPTHEIARLNYKGSEVLVPLVDEVIQKVDEKEKKLFVNLPEGLLDVYL